MYVMHSGGRGDGGQWQCFNGDEEEHKEERRPGRPPQPADIDTPHPHSARHPRRRLLLRRHHYLDKYLTNFLSEFFLHSLDGLFLTDVAPDTNDTEMSTTLIRYLIQLIGKAMVPERDQRMQTSAPRYANEAANFSPISSQQPLRLGFSVANRLIRALGWNLMKKKNQPTERTKRDAKKQIKKNSKTQTENNVDETERRSHVRDMPHLTTYWAPQPRGINPTLRWPWPRPLAVGGTRGVHRVVS